MAKKTPKSAKTGNKKKSTRPSRKTSTKTGSTRTVPKRRVVATSEKETRTPKEPQSRRAKEPSQKPSTEVVLPFTKMNFILLGIGVAVIILGFFLMSLDNFVDATKFSISLYIAPIVVIAGFAEIIYAIMYKPKTEKKDSEADVITKPSEKEPVQ